MDKETLPPQVTYWLSAEAKHDCFFVVGAESGPTERIGAFKTLLAGHSEPLRNMLEDSKVREQGDIRVPDTEPNTFKLFLTCIYGSGHCDDMMKRLTLEGSLKLLYLVEKYLVSTVKKKLRPCVLYQLPVSPEADAKTISNVFTALSSPVCFQDSQLEKVLSDIIQFNVEQIFSHERFVHLSSAALLFIVKQDTLHSSEGVIWKAVLKWAKHVSKSDDPSLQREHINQHLKYIRFRSMSLEYFVEYVVKTGILKPEEVIEVCIYIGIKKCSDMKFICNVATPRYNPRAVVSSADLCKLMIRYTIRNISKLKGDHFCDEFQCGKALWCVLVKKVDGHLAIYLYCKGHSTSAGGIQVSPWSYEVEYDLLLCNKQSVNDFTVQYTKTFTQGKLSNWGYHKFYSWKSLLDQSKGFIKDDSIIVAVKIKSVVEK